MPPHALTRELSLIDHTLVKRSASVRSMSRRMVSTWMSSLSRCSSVCGSDSFRFASAGPPATAPSLPNFAAGASSDASGAGILVDGTPSDDCARWNEECEPKGSPVPVVSITSHGKVCATETAAQLLGARAGTHQLTMQDSW